MMKKTLPLLFAFCMPITLLFAQEAAQPADDGQSLRYIVWSLAVLVALLLVAAFLLVYGYARGANAQGGLFSANKSAAATLEKEIEMEHEYDGIRELDNTLPSWWTWMFYASIVFAVVYLYYYHFSGHGALSLDEYKKEIAEAEIAKSAFMEKAANLVNENTVVALKESADLKNGEKTYSGLCVPCHGAAGEGKPSLGPNLTDEYWLHGGSIKDVFKTIKFGVTGKAMIAWQDQLSPRQIQEVASYVLSLQGTNPPNAKEPEGQLYTPQDASL